MPQAALLPFLGGGGTGEEPDAPPHKSAADPHQHVMKGGSSAGWLIVSPPSSTVAVATEHFPEVIADLTNECTESKQQDHEPATATQEEGQSNNN
jgi:hypothetical protein